MERESKHVKIKLANASINDAQAVASPATTEEALPIVNPVAGLALEPEAAAVVDENNAAEEP